MRGYVFTLGGLRLAMSATEETATFWVVVALENGWTVEFIYD